MGEREDIEQYYDRGVETEWSRMDRRPIEFELTKRHICSLLKPASLIADIGSGPGRYAIFLAEMGHRLTLVDLSQGNLDRAIQEATRRRISFVDSIHASATDLHLLADQSFDTVICLGPMYHITDPEQRRLALSECTRILKVGGTIFIAFLSPYSHAISLILNERLEEIRTLYSEFRAILSEHRNRDVAAVRFTHAWYPPPASIRSIVEGFGIRTERVAAVESLGWALEKQLDKLSAAAKAAWLDYLFDISSDPSVIGAAQHILFCGTKDLDSTRGAA